jgi:hypothetical protein
VAEPISAVSSVQLTVLQAPEIARGQVPIAAQAQIANAQAPAIIAKHDQDALETVQELQQADRRGVPDTLDGSPGGELPAYRDRTAQQRALAERAIPLAAAHPRGLGATVDIRA